MERSEMTEKLPGMLETRAFDPGRYSHVFNLGAQFT
jgi:hypothetical protein